jgi:hypothetical protein
VLCQLSLLANLVFMPAQDNLSHCAQKVVMLAQLSPLERLSLLPRSTIEGRWELKFALHRNALTGHVSAILDQMSGSLPSLSLGPTIIENSVAECRVWGI